MGKIGREISDGCVNVNSSGLSKHIIIYLSFRVLLLDKAPTYLFFSRSWRFYIVVIRRRRRGGGRGVCRNKWVA